jgi:hypothetical protein
MARKIFNDTTGGIAFGAGKDGTNGNYITFENGVRIYSLIVAITPNTTTTTAPIGSLALTSHATGRGRWYVSDGSKWQNVPNS